MIWLAALLIPLEQAPVDRQDAVDQQAVAAIVARARAGLSSDPRPAVQGRSRAERAKARAALRLLIQRGLVEGDDISSALCEDVEQGDYSAHMNSVEDLDNSLYAAEALHAWAAALDLSDGLPCAGALAAGVVALAEDLDAGFNQRLSLILRGYNQNHRLKVFAALAAARLAIDQRVELSSLQRIIDELVRITHATAHSRGGYTEGPSYWSYQSKQAIPVFLALGLDDSQCIDVPPFFMPWTCTVVHQTWRWAGRVRVPAAPTYFAPFDDSTPGAWFNFAMIPDPEALALGRMGGGFDPTWAAEVLAWRWRGEAAELAPRRLIEDYAAGQLGLADDDRGELLMMQAEYGLSAGEGRDQNGDEIQGTAGHNQSAPLSLMWHRGDRWRLIDPGYLGWSHRRPVAAAEHHSMPLIDGRGPTGPVPHVPRLIDDGNGGLVPEDPNEEGGYVLTPGGRAYGEVVSQGLTGLGLWTLVVARRDSNDADEDPALRRLLLHHPDGHLIVVDQLASPGVGGMDLHFQVPNSLTGEADRWLVPASDGDSAFEIRSHRVDDDGLHPMEGSRRGRIHDAWHWRQADHAQLAFSVRAAAALVVTTFIDQGAGGPSLQWRDGALIIDDLPALRFGPGERLQGWSLGDAVFTIGGGLRDAQAGIEPLASGDRPWPAELGDALPFARFIPRDETPSPGFMPKESVGDARAWWRVLVRQPHQAPAQWTFRRSPPSSEPAEGCSCAGQGPGPSALGMLLLMAWGVRRRRRAR